MPCLILDLPEPPKLPEGFSISPPNLGTFSGDLALCCKLLNFNIPIIVPLPSATINIGLFVAINAAMEVLLGGYIDLLPIKCPRD